MKRIALVIAVAVVLLAAVQLATARTTSRPGVVGVKFSCLNRGQRAFVVAEIDRGSAGAALLTASSVPSTCVVRPDQAGSLAQCGAGGTSFSTGCVLTALAGKQYGTNTAMVSIINPDSMRPEDLVGANPTPHP